MDRVVVGLMVLVPTLLVAVAGLGAGDRVGPAVLHQLGRDRPDLRDAKNVGLKNYHDVVTIYPPFSRRSSTT